jgi:hypothetical protein
MCVYLWICKGKFQITFQERRKSIEAINIIIIMRLGNYNFTTNPSVALMESLDTQKCRKNILFFHYFDCFNLSMPKRARLCVYVCVFECAKGKMKLFGNISCFILIFTIQCTLDQFFFHYFFDFDFMLLHKYFFSFWLPLIIDLLLILRN